MLLTIYAILMAIVLVTIVASIAYDSIILKVVGFSLLFIFNAPFVIGEGLEYQTGFSKDIVQINTTHSQEVETHSYSSYDNTFYLGFLFSIVGLFSASWCAYEEYKSGKNRREHSGG